MKKIPKRKDMVQNLVINQQRHIADLQKELIDFINLTAYVYNALESKDSTPEHVDNAKKLMKQVIGTYLDGDSDNVITAEGKMVTGEELLKQIKEAEKMPTPEEQLEFEKALAEVQEEEKESKEGKDEESQTA